MKTTRVCIITDELYPFTAGGIGRLIHNMLKDGLARQPALEFHLLVPERVEMQPAKVELYFGDRVKLHLCRFREPKEGAVDAHGLYPPPVAFRDSRWHAESLDLMRHLKALEASGLCFDVIEFPDFRGWAFCTLQEKHLGLAFQDALLSVRLHSSYGVLVHYEPHTMEVENIGRVEIERKSLLDADRVVAHLPCIATFNQRFYGFDEKWLEKVVVEFPPVTDGASSMPPAAPARRDLVFVTKIQPFKRPDLFIRAAAMLMRTWPGWNGRAILACHAFDQDYLAEIQGLVPPDLSHRFFFTRPGPEREELMRSGVVVIPSDYESVNLTAYEASAVGARLVLNGSCLAFGDDSPFVDGVNCHKFDGSTEGLMGAMRRALEGPDLRPVAWTAARPYWESLTPVHRRVPAPGPEPLVSIVVTNFNLGHHLPETLASLAASSYPEVEVIIVDDASTAPFDQVVLERIEKSAAESGSDLRVIRSPVRRGLAGARNMGVRASRGRYVLPLDAEDCLAPEFLSWAVAALEARPEYSGAVPTVGCFVSDEELASRQFSDFATFLGDCPTYALVGNRVSGATLLLRRSVLERRPYDERLSGYEDWELYLRLVQEGHRFLVTNQVQVFERRDPRSRHTAPGAKRHFQRVSRMLEWAPKPLHPSVRLFAVLAHAEEAVVDPFGAIHRDEASERSLESASDERPMRYTVIDMMNSTLKRMPLVHPLLKRALGATHSRTVSQEGNPGEPVPLRYEVVDRLNTALKQVPFLHTVLKRAAEKTA